MLRNTSLQIQHKWVFSFSVQMKFSFHEIAYQCLECTKHGFTLSYNRKGRWRFFVENPNLKTSLRAGIIRGTLKIFSFTLIFGNCVFMLMLNVVSNFSCSPASWYLTRCLNWFVASLCYMSLKCKRTFSSYLFEACVSTVVKCFICGQWRLLQPALEAWEVQCCSCTAALERSILRHESFRSATDHWIPVRSLYTSSSRLFSI